MQPSRIALALAVLALMISGVTGKEDHRLVKEWRDPGFEIRRFHKILIIGIADLTDERKHFENKFVTHLRGKSIDGVTSHSIVPHLDKVENRDAIIAALDERGVDAAITVRLVPLDEQTETEWADAWQYKLDSDMRIRELVEQTLPIPEKRAKRYGVEVALWDADGWDRIWSARSDTYKRKELQKEAAFFVELTMNALRDAGLFP